MKQSCWPSKCQTNIGELALEEILEEDVPAIALLELSLNPSPWSESQILNSVNSRHVCLGLKHSDQWVAYSVLSFAAGEAELLILGVAKHVQRQGIARAMLETLHPFVASKAHSFFLEVRASNIAAIALYEDLGFNQVGERKNYYPIPGKSSKEVAIIFAKDLQADA